MVLLAFLVRISLREDSCRFPKTLFKDWSFFQGFLRIVVEDQYQTLVDLLKLAKGGLYIIIGILKDSCRFLWDSCCTRFR